MNLYRPGKTTKRPINRERGFALDPRCDFVDTVVKMATTGRVGQSGHYNVFGGKVRYEVTDTGIRVSTTGAASDRSRIAQLIIAEMGKVGFKMNAAHRFVRCENV